MGRQEVGQARAVAEEEEEEEEYSQQKKKHGWKN